MCVDCGERARRDDRIVRDIAAASARLLVAVTAPSPAAATRDVGAGPVAAEAEYGRPGPKTDTPNREGAGDVCVPSSGDDEALALDDTMVGDALVPRMSAEDIAGLDATVRGASTVRISVVGAGEAATEVFRALHNLNCEVVDGAGEPAVVLTELDAQGNFSTRSRSLGHALAKKTPIISVRWAIESYQLGSFLPLAPFLAAGHVISQR